MTGPEHFHKAEDLLKAANHEAIHGGEDGEQRGDRLVAVAQVHATLAVAAAVAEVETTGRAHYRSSAWAEVFDL